MAIPDPLTLLAIALLGLIVVWAFWSLYQLDRVLRDRKHPDHEEAKQATRDAFNERWP